MNWVRGASLVAASALAACLGPPRAARAEESEPSIEEMWAKIEVHLASQRAVKKGADPGATSEKQTGSAKARPAPAKRTLDFGPLLKRLQARARERLEFAKRHDEEQLMAVRIYTRLEAFDNVAKSLARIMSSGQTARWHGWVEAEYAAAMAHLGKQRVAEQYISLSEKLLGEALAGRRGDLSAGEVKRLRDAHGFVRSYPEARKEYVELIASLTEAPDGSKQWKLVKLCDPVGGDVRLAVKWLVAVHTMRVLYPDHPVNRDGRSASELSEAYRYHEMYEECVAHVTKLLESKPWTVSYVKSGKAHWDRALSQELLANIQIYSRDRGRALGSYEKAIQYYRQFQKELPDCRYNRRDEGRDGGSIVDARIRHITETLASLGVRR